MAEKAIKINYPVALGPFLGIGLQSYVLDRVMAESVLVEEEAECVSDGVFTGQLRCALGCAKEEEFDSVVRVVLLNFGRDRVLRAFDLIERRMFEALLGSLRLKQKVYQISLERRFNGRI